MADSLFYFNFASWCRKATEHQEKIRISRTPPDSKIFSTYCSSNFLEKLCSSEFASATTFFLTVRE